MEEESEREKRGDVGEKEVGEQTVTEERTEARARDRWGTGRRGKQGERSGKNVQSMEDEADGQKVWEDDEKERNT